jgi:hypothetical protein
MSEALAKRDTSALAVADGIDTSDVRGKENISREDVTLPRLAICQSTSPEGKPDETAKYIDGLKEGDLFNSLLQTNYGRGPVTVALIDLQKRALEFERGPDGKQTKTIIDWNVRWDDPRCEFSTGPNGARIPPQATRFYDYIAIVVETGEPVVISMSKSKVPVAKKLNSLIGCRPGALWAGLYKIGVSREKSKKDGDPYFNYTVQPAGATPPALVERAAALYEQYKGKTIVTDAEPEEVGGSDIPF